MSSPLTTPLRALPPEIVFRIGVQLAFARDAARFSATCRSLRSMLHPTNNVFWKTWIPEDYSLFSFYNAFRELILLHQDTTRCQFCFGLRGDAFPHGEREYHEDFESRFFDRPTRLCYRCFQTNTISHLDVRFMNLSARKATVSLVTCPALVEEMGLLSVDLYWLPDLMKDFQTKYPTHTFQQLYDELALQRTAHDREMESVFYNDILPLAIDAAGMIMNPAFLTFQPNGNLLHNPDIKFWDLTDDIQDALAKQVFLAYRYKLSTPDPPTVFETKEIKRVVFASLTSIGIQPPWVTPGGFSLPRAVLSNADAVKLMRTGGGGGGGSSDDAA